jgi:dUTP pyrophosphatase
MRSVQFKKLYEEAKPPQRATGHAVGYDVFAYHVQDKITREHAGDLPYVLLPGAQVLIGIGVILAIPWPTEAQVRPRSGLANKRSIELRNSPGTIDPDFRGEMGVLLCNKGEEPFVIERGMRIAQLIFADVQSPVLEEVNVLPPTIRNTGGFGSTGLTDITEGTEAFDQAIHRLDISYMEMAIAASNRSNCIRGCPKDDQGNFLRDARSRLVGQTRKFGCVIVSDDNIIAQGFNAQAPGQPLCSEEGCLRDALNIPSGTQIEKCRAVHAEQYAFLKMVSSGVGASTRGATMYVTAEPCEVCAKMIAGSGIDTLVVLDDVYPNHQIGIVRAAGINVRYILNKDLG